MNIPAPTELICCTFEMYYVEERAVLIVEAP